MNSITPGLIQTDITAGKLTDEMKREILKGIPLSRLGEANDVAGVCLFLASDLSSYITGAVIRRERRNAHPLTTDTISRPQAPLPREDRMEAAQSKSSTTRSNFPLAERAYRIRRNAVRMGAVAGAGIILHRPSASPTSWRSPISMRCATDRRIRTGRSATASVCEEVKGFAARVTANGARAFILRYRIARQQRLFTIGSYPDWSASAARDEAKALKKRVDRGEDPMGERHDDRAAPTVDDLCDRYFANELPKKRPLSRRDFLAIINTIIRPKLGSRKVADVKFAEVERLHGDVSSHAPVGANRVVSLLRTLFNLAIKWGYRSDNPCKGIEWNPEDRRERYLSPAELVSLAAALQEHTDQRSADAIRLLVLTGARRGEVLAATWGRFDLAAGVWTKPSSHTTQKRIHRVPLSAPAVALLTSIRERQADGELYVFPGDISGRPLTDIKKSWAAVCKKAKIDGARVHDLRHTFASILVSGGGSLPLIGAMLGHTQVHHGSLQPPCR